MEMSPSAVDVDVDMEQQPQLQPSLKVLLPEKKPKRRDFCHVCHSSTSEGIKYHRQVGNKKYICREIPQIAHLANCANNSICSLTYRVPKDRASQWAAALKLPLPLKDSVRVCSKHIRTEDYVDGDRARGRLTQTAIPISLPGVPEEDLVFAKPPPPPPPPKKTRRNFCHLCGSSREKGIQYHRYKANVVL